MSSFFFISPNRREPPLDHACDIIVTCIDLHQGAPFRIGLRE